MRKHHIAACLIAAVLITASAAEARKPRADFAIDYPAWVAWDGGGGPIAEKRRFCSYWLGAYRHGRVTRRTSREIIAKVDRYLEIYHEVYNSSGTTPAQRYRTEQQLDVLSHAIGHLWRGFYRPAEE